jgi:hypothetical protein
MRFGRNNMPKFGVHLVNLHAINLKNLFEIFNEYQNVLQPNHHIWCSLIFHNVIVKHITIIDSIPNMANVDSQWKVMAYGTLFWPPQ